MRRVEIEARVEVLAREHEGRAFVAAVARLNEELDTPSRDVLAEVLLDRANAERSVDEALRTAKQRRWSLFRLGRGS